MGKKLQNWTPETSTTMWRFLGLLCLCLVWMNDSGSEVGLILLLFLVIMALARWLFPLPGWTILIDQGACFVTLFYWPFASLGLALPMFEGMTKGKFWFILPTLVFMIVNPQTSILLVVVLIQAGLVGWLIRGWLLERKTYQQEADQQRHDKYELENLKEELLLANVQVARMAGLSERNRIAQELHDDVGHELTASVLALQAFEQLWKEEDPAAEEMFYLAKQRLLNSAVYLRETVHNMKPVKELGIGDLQELCNLFTACPINLNVYGDTSKVPVYLWSILQPCLKEALTNIVRHAQATRVEVSLDINPHILRLSVQNDGISSRNQSVGIGLRNLRQRAKAVGGSISTDTSDGFLLICVLPLDERQ